MIRRTMLAASAAMLLPSLALAQIGGGGGGGGRGGGRGGRGGGQGGGSPSSSRGAGEVPPGERPTNQIVITGVIMEIDRAAERVTIAYDPVEELNWPKGTMPFPVSKSELLKDRKVGEKVRFKVESHEIYDLQPASSAAPAG